MNICIIGHGRHGKDTVAEMIAEEWPGFNYEYGTSWFASVIVFEHFKEHGWPATIDLLAADNFTIDHVYDSPAHCWANRHKHRKEWFDIIGEYNALDEGVALYRDCLEEQNILTGIRKTSEMEALKEHGLVDCTIWVHRDGFPGESATSMELGIWDADFSIDNDGDLGDLRKKIKNMGLIFSWKPDHVSRYDGLTG